MPAFNVMYSAMDNVGINYTVTNTDDSGINIQNYTVYEGALVLNQDAYIGHMHQTHYYYHINIKEINYLKFATITMTLFRFR